MLLQWVVFVQYQTIYLVVNSIVVFVMLHFWNYVTTTCRLQQSSILKHTASKLGTALVSLMDMMRKLSVIQRKPSVQLNLLTLGSRMAKCFSEFYDKIPMEHQASKRFFTKILTNYWLAFR